MNLPMWDLPDEIKRRFGQRGAGRQRAMVADGHLLLVLHKAPQRGERERKAVFFWRKPDGEWKSSGKGEGLWVAQTYRSIQCRRKGIQYRI